MVSYRTVATSEDKLPEGYDMLKKRYVETGLDESSIRSEERKRDQEKYMSDAMF